MASIEVRPFRRRDREQLTELVNAHAQAVVPGVGVSVSMMLSQLERQPNEAIVDPFVSERSPGRRHRRHNKPDDRNELGAGRYVQLQHQSALHNWCRQRRDYSATASSTVP